MGADGLARMAGDSETVMLGLNKVTFLLGEADTGGRFSLTEFLMAPPPAPGPPLHIHTDEEETIYLIDGHLRVTLRDEVTELAGSAVAHVRRGVPHTLANIGDVPARLLIVQSPPGAERYWAKAAELIAATGGNPDPGRMRQLAEEHHIRFQQPRQFS